MPVVTLIFLLIAVLMIVAALFPAWDFAAGPALAVNRLIGLLVGLIILYILYLIVLAILGIAPLPLVAR